MASILEWNTNYARENNLPIAATFEKLLAIPGGATLFDHQYNINNWEDLAEGLGEQLVDELQSKGQKQFLLDNARKITYAGAGPNDQDFKNFVQTLNTLPLTQAEADKVNIDVQQGVADLKQSQASVAEFERNFKMPGGGFGNLVGDVGKVTKQLAANPVVQIGLAYYMPGIVNSFAPSLGAFGITGAAQTAVANAIASTAVQVAQGVPLDKALQTAVTNAVVSSGSPAIAKDINKVIENPAVTDAIVSAGASAAKTALNGGSQADIERNLAAGLVGSGVATATGSSVAGSAAGGAVTGGVTGALTGAANQYVSELAAENLAKEKAAAIKKSTEELNNKVSDIIGEELKKVGIAGALPAGETGAYARALELSNQALIRLVKEAANDPAYLQKLPALEEALVKAGTSLSKILGTGLSLGTYTSELNSNEQAELQKRLKDAKIEITLSPLPLTDPNAGRVPVAPGVDLTKPEPTPEPIPSPAPEPVYDPRIVTPITPITPAPAPISQPVTTPQPSIRDKEILDLINPPATSPAPQPAVRPAPVPRPKPGTPSRLPPVALPIDVSQPSGGGTPSRPVTQEPETGGEPPIEEIPPVEEPVEEPVPPTSEEPTPPKKLPPVEDKTGTPVDKPYKPNLFIYGGTTPSTLTQTLRTNLPTARTTTGTSVGLGGRGEIESKESGKKRQNVWNEESLRLKDALGL